MRERVEQSEVNLAESYRQTDRSLRIRYFKVVCFWTLLFIPAGASLDYFVYREHLSTFFLLRAMADVIVGSLFLIHFTTFGQRHIRALGIILTLLVNVTITLMIYLSEGPGSPCYAGLNLIILTVAVFLPWTLGETLLVCISTIGMYMAACLLHGYTTGLPIENDILYNNIFFLLLTSLICGLSSHINSKARYEDFLLRHELDLRNRELEELDRLKSEFFANISHELRTPLTLILTPVEDLLKRSATLPDRVHDSLLLVMQNALRLLKLINDLLDTIRLEEGAMKLAKEPVDLSTFLPGIVDSIRHLGGTKNQVFRVERPNRPLIVHGDPNRLEKVFLNLLSNAIKFTPVGGAITSRLHERSTFAVIEIEDNGAGISKEELPKIFDRFHQAADSTKAKSHGVGIGLALARDLVEEHDGTISAESEPDQGTTIRVELPLLPDSEAEQQLNPTSYDDGTKEPFADAFSSADRILITERSEEELVLPDVGEGEHTILVVDDEPDMRRFLVSKLAEDYRVLQASNGESGIEKARANHPDLILLDWMLPGKDGIDLCRELRRDKATSEIKIVLLTARVDEVSKIRALEEGADDFLTKPFSTIEVETRIANLLRTADLQRNLRVQNTELEDTLSRLKETETQLVQSEKMRALGTLAAGILHEINNPLNFTITALQFGMESVPKEDEDLRETLEDIGEGMNRINRIVSELHAFAYPEEEGKVEVFYLKECFESALRLVAHEVQDLQLVNEIEESQKVTGSHTQIVHLFINLLMNSSKAVRSVEKLRKPEIRVSDRRENGRVQVEVWDNGYGIRNEVFDKIFDPFFTTREVGEGLGLGLSICHTIVKNHGGSISAKSEENRFTAFTFDLPASKE